MALVTLQTATTQETVEIDGKEYPLVDLDGLGIASLHKLTGIGKRLRDLTALDDLTDEQAADLEAAVDELYQAVAEHVPAEVSARLSVRQRQQIVTAFFFAGKSAKDGPTTSSDGPETPSPDSSDSTEELPATG